MACNCEGKKYNIGMGCCTPVLAPIENYYTKWQVDDLIESATTSGCCITPEEVDEKIESAKTEIEAEIPSLSGYATEKWVLDKNYITGVDLSDYALKSEIPTVPTSNTAFTNDAGYLTEHQSLSAYSTTDEVNSAIAQAVSGKQDTLSAGTNITIVDNIISATGGGGGKPIEGGRGITVTTGTTADTVSFNLPISAGTSTNSIKENMSGNVASGSYSHSEGFNTFARGNFGSHAEGQGTTAKGNASHSEGGNTNAYNDFEHASGLFNVSNSASTEFGNSGNTLFSVGNGTADNTRHNAFEIRQNGDIYITSGGTDIKLQDHIGGGTATTYTAGDNITISNQNVISTITKFWCGTQQQYDAITTKDPNTVYMIHS